MRFDLVIFDFDGTLADSFPFFLQVHDTLARRHGFRPLAGEDLQALRALPTRALFARSGLSRWRLPWVARDFQRAMAANHAPVPLFPGIAGAIAALRASGCRLAILTSNSRLNVERALGPPLASTFEGIEAGAPVFGKARRLRRLAARLGVAPARSLYVGDQAADAEAAAAAGMAFGAVAWGYAPLPALEARQPARRFREVAQLATAAARAWRVRPATGDDAGALHALMQALAAEDGQPDGLRTDLSRLRAHGPGGEELYQAWMGELDDEPVAYLTATREYSIWAGGPRLRVDDLYVRPHARGAGLGAALLRRAREQAAALGCVDLRWTVEVGNHRAIALYRRLGAQVQAKGQCTWPVAGAEA